MQYDNHKDSDGVLKASPVDVSLGQKRPASVTVISVLGIIYAVMQFFIVFAMFGKVMPSDIGVVVMMMNGFVGLGFLVSCILMLNRRFAGKVIYHIMSVVSFLYFAALEFMFLTGAVLGSTVAVVYNDHHAASSLMLSFIISLIVFVILTVISAVFNFMLCTKRVSASWER